MRPARKASTATSLAADRIAGAVPPEPPRLVGEREAREGLEIGDLEVEAAERRPVDRAVRASAAGSGAPSASAIGRRMSGIDSCAIVAPSQNSTMLCTIDCGCTTTSMRSKPTPNSSCASITSSPLFISVELSTVILAPMFHVGCASASAIVTSRSCSRVRPRNGPPLAVSTMRADLGRAPGAQALPDRGVLGVDGDDLAAARGARLGDDRPGRDQALLVRERETLARLQRGERRRQPREPDDRVEHDVGVGQRGELGEHARDRRRTRGPGRRERRTRPPGARAARCCARPRAPRPGSRRGDATTRRAPACRSIRSIRG